MNIIRSLIRHLRLIILLLPTLFGCHERDSNTKSAPLIWEEINGRDTTKETRSDQGISSDSNSEYPLRHPIYRVLAPNNWTRRDPLPDESIADTMKPLSEYIISEEGKTVRITIHNFPSHSIEQRIPTEAQITRWKKQFTNVSEVDSYDSNETFNGYVGLMIHCQGDLEGKEMSMIAWAMQLPRVHYTALVNPKESKLKPICHQMRSDITIKALGDTSLVEKYKDEIFAFGRSFELILEIPQE